MGRNGCGQWHFHSMIAVLIYYLGLYVFHIQLSDSAAFVTILILSAFIPDWPPDDGIYGVECDSAGAGCRYSGSTQTAGRNLCRLPDFYPKINRRDWLGDYWLILAFGGFDKSLAANTCGTNRYHDRIYFFIPLICLIYSCI
ncbi:hypothetical protein DMH17_17235 [Raoultella planticola]|nr:hypothetical protein [Raoultella planticola]